MEPLLSLIMQDTAFLTAVQNRDTRGAAIATLGVIKHQWRSFAQVLQPGPAGGGALPEGGSPYGRRSSDGTGAAPPVRVSDVRVGDRVVINNVSKRLPQELIGRQGTVVYVGTGGWVKVAIPGRPETLEIQSRFLALCNSAPAETAAAAAVTANLRDYQSTSDAPSQGHGGSGTGAGARYGNGLGGLARSGSYGLERFGGMKGRGQPKPREVVKVVRREVAALEEEVPWGAVDPRWRGLRRSWQRRLRNADAVKEVAQCIRELHDSLLTDKLGGTFVAGGPWQRALWECCSGLGNHTHLQAVWDEARSALHAWLTGRQQSGGMGSTMDKASHEVALRCYQALQDAAALGPEHLDQVPLDLILSNQREMTALQHIIQREQAAAQARVIAAASGSGGGGGGGGAPGDAGVLVGSDAAWECLMADNMLAAIPLDKLPRLGAGDEDDVDTDADMGSEATDMEDSAIE